MGLWRRPWPWRELGIDATTDTQAIREAYARKVTSLGLSTSTTSFSRLNEARDAALSIAASGITGTVGEPQEPEAHPTANGSRIERLFGRLEIWRLWIVTLALVALLLMKLLGVVTNFFDEPEDDGRRVVSKDYTWNGARVDEVVPALFGESFTYERLKRANPAFAEELISGIGDEYGDTDLENARSFLRSTMMNSRAFLPRTELLQLSRLQLSWLRAAREEGGTACREVTGHSYFDGVPMLDKAALSEEQAIAREWIASIDFVPKGVDNPEPQRALPTWTMAAVQRSTGLDPIAINASLANLTDQHRCDVTIALLEALLARPQDAPSSLLVSI
ncbi:hypothetical protein [Qipengyuania soli]|uniref:J domain-containing protein n=1 Tax=Qipengyuania soli TaxID=2782568 RepID=A0A7S8F3S3_9SPHN|nr:hypothetical protein [Qipengyuania soli]QPC98602.1 hypothetical protein IRL76_12245 [Qipengyuania soli]